MTLRSPIQEAYGATAPRCEEAEERFFKRLRLPNGVYKTTAAHRLDDVNHLVAGFLPDERPLQLMDVAISSGITTLDWSEQLTAAGIAHTMVATDTYTEGVWFSFGWADVVLDGECRQTLYADVFGRGVDTGRDSWRSMVVANVLTVLARYPFLRPRVRHIPLVSPRLQGCTAISVVQDDIFDRRHEFVGRFHAVRAANILNRGYFDDVRITRGVANLRERLRPDGLLIVCRTDSGGGNHGTVFRMDDAGCEAVARIGDGSEIEELVVRG